MQCNFIGPCLYAPAAPTILPRLKQLKGTAIALGFAAGYLFSDSRGHNAGVKSNSRVTASWAAVAGTFGLPRAKDTFSAVRCHPIPVTNRQFKNPAAASTSVSLLGFTGETACADALLARIQE
jgi:hypothetical protein